MTSETNGPSARERRIALVATIAGAMMASHDSTPTPTLAEWALSIVRESEYVVDAETTASRVEPRTRADRVNARIVELWERAADVNAGEYEDAGVWKAAHNASASSDTCGVLEVALRAARAEAEREVPADA